MGTRPPRVLAIIQAGGKGGRMDVLTRETPKPALPFAGAFKMIDFPLSNLRNSGVTDVWLSVQYLAQDLADAVANGKPWDLDRHHGGFRLVMPQGGGTPADEGFVSGNAEELLANRDAITRHDPDVLLVLSADHAYRLDYRDVVAEHLARGAECTLVTTEIDVAEAGNHTVVDADDEGRVTGLHQKPDDPPHGRVATEVFVYDPRVLVRVLEDEHRRLANDPDRDPESDGSALGDFAEHLLPALVERGRTRAVALPGYWRDLGRPEAYFAAHAELLHTDVDLFEPDWPITTNSARHLPARHHAGADVTDSLVSAGGQVHGTVRSSVLGPGVVVGPGAEVRDCVLFADVVVGAGARLSHAVVADRSVVGRDARVGRPPEGTEVGADDLVLVGPDCTIGAGSVLEPGARLEPGSVTDDA